MKKALIFIGGLVSGIVLTILALVIVSYYSNSNSDYSFFEKAGERIDYNAFEVFQVLDNGDALAKGREYGDYSIATGITVIIIGKEDQSYYDDQIIEIPEGKTIIDIVPSEVVLDNGRTVIDPVGNLSSNFTLKAQIILADKEYVRQLSSIFKRVGIEIDGIVPTALAERNLMLDTNELYDNVMLLDIGAGNTEIGVFEGNTFIYTNTIPLGGDNITNDLSLVLNISEEEAEKLKKQYGLALRSFIDNDNEIMLNTCKDESRNKVIKSSELIEIIEARIEEIFTIVNKDITKQNIKQNINTVILTGRGITNINKSDVAGKINLNIPVKMSTGRAISTVKPEFRTSYALVRYIAARPFTKSVSSNIDSQANESVFKVIMDRIKEFFYS